MLIILLSLDEFGIRLKIIRNSTVNVKFKVEVKVGREIQIRVNLMVDFGKKNDIFD